MKIKGLKKVYKTSYETITVLNNINLFFPQKGLVFVVGASGSGKTTLINMLSGIDNPTEGEVLLGEKSLFDSKEKTQLFAYRNSYVGIIFQDNNLIEELDVYDNIKLPLEFVNAQDFEIIDEVVKKVDIEEIKHSRVNEISAGQMQRVAIARALVKNSSMIIADEPTGNLDTKNEKIVMDLLQEISKERLVVVITHNQEVADEYADRIIEIEDGNIISDSAPEKDTEEDTPNFIKPNISFKNQVKLTKGFAKNNLVRSLMVCLISILIPLIGGILCSYVFYDVADGFIIHQEKYDSEYIVLSDKIDNYNVYYGYDEVGNAINQKYGNQGAMELYDIDVPINPDGLSGDSFYKPTIQSLIVPTSSSNLKVTGSYPVRQDSSEMQEIMITDYLAESLKYYQGIEDPIGAELKIYTKEYLIVGIVQTNFEKFKTKDFNKEYVQMAFNENLYYYNAIFSYVEVSFDIYNDCSYFKETGRIKPFGNDKFIYFDFKVYRYGDYTIDNLIVSKNPPTGTYAYVSSALYEEILNLRVSGFTSYSGINNYLGVVCYSKSKYFLPMDLGGVFESDEYAVVISNDYFDRATTNFIGCRYILPSSSKAYNEVVNNENVINESFVYAKGMWDKTKDSKIVMIEFIVVLILITITFASIVNSITMTSEKKTIGIKYSFGMSKGSIIVPYVLEMLAYIIIGTITSIIVINFIFPALMKALVYTSALERKQFDFFYTSLLTITGWDLIIYAIILGSLLIMIFKICKKSPIEIIKDL